jgi:hypothetical protein
MMTVIAVSRFMISPSRLNAEKTWTSEGRAEQVAIGVQLGEDVQRVVLHVGEVRPQPFGDGPVAAQHLGQYLAGGREQPGHPEQFLAEPEQIGRRAFRPGEDRLLDPVDPPANPVLHREVAVHQALEEGVRQARHAVVPPSLVTLPAPPSLLQHRQHRAGAAMDGDQVILAPEQVELPRQKDVSRRLHGVHHHEVIAGVAVAARALVRPDHVLQRQLVEAEGAPQQRHLVGTGVADVEPDAVLPHCEQLAQTVGAHLGGHAAIRRVYHESDGSHGASFRADRPDGP